MIKEKVSSGNLNTGICDSGAFQLRRRRVFAVAEYAEYPWQFSGNQGLYSREEVKLCINFLRAAANLSDSMSLYYLVSSEVYGLT